jgi:dimethylaniline monooxygenase (N-oxide forming)
MTLVAAASTARAAGRRVAVIGAGAAGLCAAKTLLARGARVVVYEIGSCIGGLWVFNNDSGLAPAYASLHLNSEHKVTAYKDFPFPADSPLYPDHTQVRSYLESYAEHFGVTRHIRFKSKVLDVAPHAGRWRVQLESSATGGANSGGNVHSATGISTGTLIEEFDAVVVASGHQGSPSHPAWRDQFTGEYLHSHVYRVPEPFRDKRVLVVGMGNSAVDIAADICVVTESTTLSARSPVLVMPRMLFGVPTSRVLAKIEKPWMPWAFKRTVREFLVRIVYGRMEQWGLTTPKTRTHPTSHTTLMQHFVWSRITAKPGIEKVEGQTVYFNNGTQAEYDTIIAGTGYSVSLPFLAPALHPLAGPSGHQLELFLRVVHPQQRGLYFAGMFNVAGGGNIRMMDDQAEWITALVCGEEHLPAEKEMRVVMQQEQAYLQRHFPGSPRYALELDPPFYRKQLGRERALGRKRPAGAQSLAEGANIENNNPTGDSHVAA